MTTGYMAGGEATEAEEPWGEATEAGESWGDSKRIPLNPGVSALVLLSLCIVQGPGRPGQEGTGYHPGIS